MGQVRSKPVTALLFFAVFSGEEQLLDQTIEQLAKPYGPVLFTSGRFPFDQTKYYQRTMGAGLTKELIAIDRIITQDELADIKLATNEMEEAIGTAANSSVERPVNIDPGMVDDGKAMLASTKNHAHRVYVRNGIFVEVTTYLREGKWEAWPWTYRDYRLPEVHAFFDRAREHFRTAQQASGYHSSG